jgi:phosphatidylglycerophosphate synthase
VTVADIVRPPGLLSLSRLPLAVAFVPAADRPPWAIATLAAAGISDVLDGWVARRLHQETADGAVLDGVMDKVFAVTVLVTLIARGAFSPEEVLALGAREIGEAPLVVRALLRGDRQAGQDGANAFGKVTTVLQFTSAVLVLLNARPRGAFIAATGVCGALAAISYWRRELRKSAA